MLYINVPDMNDSVGRITLDEREYYVRFTYNPSCEYWSFGLYDSRMIPIIAMTKIVPNSHLFRYYTYTDLPNGMFGCVSNLEKVTRNDFINGKARFLFATYEEIIAAFKELEEEEAG